MTPAPRCRLLDLGCVAGLLLSAAVPVVLLRDSPLPRQGQFLLGWLALAAAVVPLWTFLARRSRPGEPAVRPAGEPLWWTPLVAVLLGRGDGVRVPAQARRQ